MGIFTALRARVTRQALPNRAPSTFEPEVVLMHCVLALATGLEDAMLGHHHGTSHPTAT